MSRAGESCMLCPTELVKIIQISSQILDGRLLLFVVISTFPFRARTPVSESRNPAIAALVSTPQLQLQLRTNATLNRCITRSTPTSSFYLLYAICTLPSLTEMPVHQTLEDGLDWIFNLAKRGSKIGKAYHHQSRLIVKITIEVIRMRPIEDNSDKKAQTKK